MDKGQRLPTNTCEGIPAPSILQAFHIENREDLRVAGKHADHVALQMHRIEGVNRKDLRRH